jgi:hypothetical protein
MQRGSRFKKVVGARGCEPRASCSQGRLIASCKSLTFRRSIADSKLKDRQELCLDVAGCSHLNVGSLQKSLQSPLAEYGARA